MAIMNNGFNPPPKYNIINYINEDLNESFDFYLEEILQCRLGIINDSEILMNRLLKTIWPNIGFSAEYKSYHAYIYNGSVRISYLTKPDNKRLYIKASVLYAIMYKLNDSVNIDQVQILEF